MADRGEKRSYRKMLVSTLLVLIMVAVSAFVCIFSLAPQRYSVVVGSEMPETVRASQTIRDKNTGSVLFEKDAVIIGEGAIVTEYDFDILKTLGLIEGESSDIELYISVGLLLIGAYAVFVVFATKGSKPIIKNMRYMTIISLCMVMSILIAWGLRGLSVFIMPTLLPVLLMSLLIGENTAYGILITSSIVFGLLGGAKGDALSSVSAIIMITTLLSGSIGIPLMRGKHSRSSLLVGGGIASLINGTCVVVCMLMFRQSADVILTSGALSLAGGVISTILCVGTMPVWESVFDISTSSRLYELTNANHPLLKQLMTDAPGTYHHSVMVALLAESAAEAIGADPALARVGGYYHDVGKLRRPSYFRENQVGDNIHDTLPPSESASIIIAHQLDSVAVLTKFRLPGDVIKIAAEHHGNSLMSYFYAKARALDPDVTTKGFRYSGNRPSTTESAIVMLADCCEAAVRSLGTTDKAEIESMVHKVISSKHVDKDGMLMNSPLTLQQISMIERAFLKTFNGILHDRVKYPELEVKYDK